MNPQDPQNQQPAQQPVDQTAQIIQFVDSMINEKFANQMDQVTPEVRDELRQDLLVRLDDFIMARIIAEFSDENLATFENMIKEGKTREELQQFATEHIPDFTNFATDAFLEFRTVYLGSGEE